MNYLDIKDQVIEVTSNLELVPKDIAEPYVEDQWELRRASLWQLDKHTHPSVQSVVHCMMHYDSTRFHTVRTVLVDGAPAFFFIRGGRYGGDYCKCYLLNKVLCKKFIKYLVILALDEWLTERTGFLPQYLPEVEDSYLLYEDTVQVDEHTHIPGLSDCMGMNFLYGAEYIRGSNGDWVNIQ